MKHYILLIFCFLQVVVLAQDVSEYEKPPVFPECKNQDVSNLKSCFQNQLSQFVYSNFKIPEIVTEENYKGEVVVLFEVNTEGNFVVIYTDAIYDELKEETKRVFGELPKIKPATYNGITTFKQYSYRINIPLQSPEEQASQIEIQTNETKISELEQLAKSEYDSINTSLKNYQDKEFSSQLNIPFTHQGYAKFDRSLNLIGTNSHTASKPFMYEDIEQYHDFKAAKEALKKEGNSWWTKKLFNEHLVQIQSDDYWFTLDPIFDFQVGRDSDADFNTTFNNTRGFYVQGGLGKKLSFSASVYESQGRFAQYFNEYAESLKAFGPDPAIITGRGIGKGFKDDAYDYPVAEAYLSFTPAKFINVQFGHGKNFIGDG